MNEVSYWRPFLKGAQGEFGAQAAQFYTEFAGEPQENYAICFFV